MVRAAVYLLFFLSGATALVYEVAWTRRMSLVLGSTTLAVSLILAAWMLGLALGARLSGARADRAKNPLLLYAVLEGLIGVLAFLFPVLLWIARTGALAAGGSRAVAFVLTFAALLIPTTLMGATLPVLSRFVVTRISGMGGRIGLLYGINTLGAVFGTFLSGFFLVRILGVFGSTYAAGALNLLIAGAALLLALRARDASPALPEAGPGAEVADEGGLPVPRIVLLTAFAAGFVSLASEVLWTRMLVFFLEGFTYTFSAMLTTFLAGLALGALVSGIIVNRVKDLRRYLGWLFVVSAFVSAGVLFLLTRHFDVTNWSKDVTAGISMNWRVHHAASLFVASFVTLFPPALVMGAIFPAVARLATRHVGEVGSKVGRVYAVNTLGAVVGSLLAGLVLVRWPGMAWGAAGLALAGALVGLYVLGGKKLFPALPVVAATVTIVVLARPGVEFIRHSHVFKGERELERELLTYEEGAYAAVGVVEDVRNGIRAVYTDEFQAAATGPQYKYMRMLAHLPLLVAPKWEGADVLVICFGTGTTAGSATAHPLGRLDLVEISKEVLAQAPYFRDVNKGVLEPDADFGFPVDVHVDDGRNYLLRTDRTWDVISLEPLMPYTPGAVNLYTEDFYRLAKGRLADDGVMCQWIPIHAMSTDDYRMLLRSFVSVFPESTLWFVEGTSLVIGTAGPLEIDFDSLVKRIRTKKIVRDLESIEFEDPLQVLNSYVTGGEALRLAVEDASLMTDEHPLMEFRPVPFKWPNSFLADNLAFLHGLRVPVSEILRLTGVSDIEQKALLAALRRYYAGGQAFLLAENKKALSSFFGAVGDMKRQQEFYRDALRAYEDAARLNPDDASIRYLRNNALYGWLISLGLLELKHGRLAEAERRFGQAIAIDNAFKPDLAFTYLGKTLNRMGRYEAAFAVLEGALERYPNSPTALAERGYARFKLGDARGAAEDFAAADRFSVKPGADPELDAVKARVEHAAEKGLISKPVSPQVEAKEIVTRLRGAEGAEVGTLMARLKVVYRNAPDRVRALLADDADRARDPAEAPERQLFAICVLVGLGDLPGTLDLLATGTPDVRESAADALGRVKKPQVVPALIEAMADPDRRVREAAWAGLFVLTGMRPKGYEPDGPEAARTAEVENLRTWWKKVGEGYEFR